MGMFDAQVRRNLILDSVLVVVNFASKLHLGICLKWGSTVDLPH